MYFRIVEQERTRETGSDRVPEAEKTRVPRKATPETGCLFSCLVQTRTVLTMASVNLLREED